MLLCMSTVVVLNFVIVYSYGLRLGYGVSCMFLRCCLIYFVMYTCIQDMHSKLRLTACPLLLRLMLTSRSLLHTDNCTCITHRE